MCFACVGVEPAVGTKVTSTYLLGVTRGATVAFADLRCEVFRAFAVVSAYRPRFQQRLFADVNARDAAGDSGNRLTGEETGLG